MFIYSGFSQYLFVYALICLMFILSLKTDFNVCKPADILTRVKCFYNMTILQFLYNFYYIYILVGLFL